jgi:hypothetical protein
MHATTAQLTLRHNRRTDRVEVTATDRGTYVATYAIQDNTLRFVTGRRIDTIIARENHRTTRGGTCLAEAVRTNETWNTSA